MSVRLTDSILRSLADNPILEQEIKTKLILNIPHAYVIYNQWREKNLETLLISLEKENIHSIGRYGAWKYASMQEAVLDGKKVVENILEKSTLKYFARQKTHQKRENYGVEKK